MNKIFFIAFILIIFSMISCDQTSDLEKDLTGENNTEENQNTDTLLISKNFVPIDWEITDIINYDENLNQCILSSSEQTKRIKRGSVISFASDTCSYVLLVKDVKSIDNNIVLNTIPGNLGDIFANTALTLSTEQESRTQNGNGLIGIVKKIHYYDENENLVAVTRANDDKKNTRLTGKIWDWSNDKKDISIIENQNAILKLKEPVYEANLDLELTLNFGGRSMQEILDNGMERWRSLTTNVTASLIGKVHTKTELFSEIFGKYHWQESDDELFIHNVFKPIYVTFYSNGVPIVVRLSADMFRGASFTTEGSLSTIVGYENNLMCKIGLEWDQKSDKLTPITSTDYQEHFTGPMINGKGTITGKVWFFPRIYLDVDGIGCSYDLKPYVGVSLSGCFNVDLQHENNFLASNMRGFAGMDLKCGYSQKFMNYEVYHKELSSSNLFEKDLFRIPEKILPEIDNLAYTDITQPREVKFEIYDYNLITGNSLSSLPIPVEFDTNGTLSTFRDFSKNGIVSVVWTPASQDDLLTATIYNPNGGILAQTIVNVNLKEQEPDERTEFFNGDIVSMTYSNNVKYSSSLGFIIKMSTTCRKPKSYYDRWETLAIDYGISNNAANPWNYKYSFDLYNSYDCNPFKDNNAAVFNHEFQIFPEANSPMIHLNKESFVATSYISAQLDYRSDLDRYSGDIVQTKFIYSRKPKISISNLKKMSNGWSWDVKCDGALWYGPNPNKKGTNEENHICLSYVGENYLNHKYDYIKGSVSYCDNWVEDGIQTWSEEASSSKLLLHDMMPTDLYFRVFVEGKEIKSRTLHLTWNTNEHKITSISY